MTTPCCRILLGLSVLVGVTSGFGLIIVSFVSEHWSTWLDGRHLFKHGLQRICVDYRPQDCRELPPDYSQGYINNSRYLMVVSIVVGNLALMFGIFQFLSDCLFQIRIFTVLLGIITCCLVAAILCLSAVLVWFVRVRPSLPDNATIGHAFYCAMATSVLFLLTSALESIFLLDTNSQTDEILPNATMEQATSTQSPNIPEE